MSRRGDRIKINYDFRGAGKNRGLRQVKTRGKIERDATSIVINKVRLILLNRFNLDVEVISSIVEELKYYEGLTFMSHEILACVFVLIDKNGNDKGELTPEDFSPRNVDYLLENFISFNLSNPEKELISKNRAYASMIRYYRYIQRQRKIIKPVKSKKIYVQISEEEEY